MTKWPKKLPPLSAEQQRINDDFMEYWHEVLPRRYGIADEFSHRYVVRHAPPGFKRTLEVGAGLGQHLNYENLTPDQRANYVMVETRQNMADRIQARFPWVQCRVGDCQARLAYPDGHFDRIIAINVLEHLPDLPAAIREMHRLCDKRAGVFSVVIPCEGGAAYGLARRISAKRIFEKRYRLPYKLFIEQEHINCPAEILEELSPYFQNLHRAFFPMPIPLLFCNLFVGLTFKPRV